jgi:hypothetical protein
MASRLPMLTLLIGAALMGTANAQWMNQPKAGVPRTRDGKPNLSAPTPRLKGKPDLTGLWQADRDTRSEIERVAPGIGTLAVPGDDPTTFNRYVHDVMADYKPGEVKLSPAAEKAFQNQPPASGASVCLPSSSPMNDVFPEPKRFVQTPQLLVILYEGDIPRQIHMDGRALPVDPQPAWVGYSIGKWEGDTLVVQTAGFNSRAPLDFSGHPRSESMRMTERMHRRDFGHLDTQVTIDDPTFYSKPITFRYTATLVPDDDLLEAVCTENEKDGAHLKP